MDIVRFDERSPTFLEPATLTADAYQLTVSEQVIYDRDSESARSLATIRNIPARAYMLMGAREEFDETCEPDGLHEYNRLARLVLPSSMEYPDASPDAIRYHIKEFGDLAWYGTNLLTFNNIRLASTLSLDMRDIRLADVDQFARMHTKEGDDYERWQHSGWYFIDSAKTFLGMAEDIARHERSGDFSMDAYYRRGAFSLAAGYLFVSMSVALQSKFGSSLAEAMTDNIAKVERRRRENKIFGAGGDTR